MENHNELIDSIQRKLERVLIQSEELQSRQQQLEQANKELSSIIENQKQQIAQLQKTNSLLTFTKSLEKGKENTDARAKIRQMISEVDKCIGLLQS